MKKRTKKKILTYGIRIDTAMKRLAEKKLFLGCSYTFGRKKVKKSGGGVI